MNRRGLAWILGSFWFMAAVSAETPVFLNERHVYERGESVMIRLQAPGVTLVSFNVDGWLPAEGSPNDGVFEYSIETIRLRSGDYTVRAQVHGGEEARFPLAIVPAHDSERMPVWRWGFGEGDPEWAVQRGFTGAFLSAIRDPLLDRDSRETRWQSTFDRAARYDFELGLYLSPLTSDTLAKDESLLSVMPDGTRDPKKPYPLEPKVIEHARSLAETWVQRFADYPGLRHVMLQSEWQSPFCVNETAAQLAKEETGLNLSDWVASKWGPGPVADGEVRDGIIEDDHPRYRFLQWWWQRGHGTAPLNEVMHDAVKARAPRLLTWHEPYRLAPVRDSHKGLDCIGTWTYGYPDIKRLCYTTYLQAAARPEEQLVQQDITLFVYGRYAVPVGESSADLSRDFAGGDPYFTAGPDYAREAMWLVVSQRPDILAFYSAGKLSPEDPSNDPYFASPETFYAIGETCDELVKPYGPAILGCARVAPRTAVLMSAASTWFAASPHLPGYPNEQTLSYATLLMMNHVPFDVVLDEDVVEGALDRYDVLVMPKADTLTRGMFDRITAFAARGGKVIADASLRAAIPGAVVTKYDFTHQLRIDGKSLAEGKAVTAEEDRAIMEGYARDLAGHLAGVPRPAEAATPRVLTNALDGGAARYHFLVNDDRTYGPRFGQWKLRFELGVAQTTQASIAIEGRPALYDALQRTRVAYEEKDGRAVFDTRLPAARGKVIAALPEPIGEIALSVPESVARGAVATAGIRVMSESGSVLDAVLPLRVEVLDALGNKTEWRRYTATKNGERVFEFAPGVNDPSGEWIVLVTDLVAGKTAEGRIRVE